MEKQNKNSIKELDHALWVEHFRESSSSSCSSSSSFSSFRSSSSISSLWSSSLSSSFSSLSESSEEDDEEEWNQKNLTLKSIKKESSTLSPIRTNSVALLEEERRKLDQALRVEHFRAAASSSSSSSSSSSFSSFRSSSSSSSSSSSFWSSSSSSSFSSLSESSEEDDEEERNQKKSQNGKKQKQKVVQTGYFMDNDVIVTKIPKGKQSLGKKRVSFHLPEKDTPTGKNNSVKTPVGKKQAIPAKGNSVTKKQATSGKEGLQKFKGMEKQNRNSKKEGRNAKQLIIVNLGDLPKDVADEEIKKISSDIVSATIHVRSKSKRAEATIAFSTEEDATAAFNVSQDLINGVKLSVLHSTNSRLANKRKKIENDGPPGKKMKFMKTGRCCCCCCCTSQWANGGKQQESDEE